MLTRSNSRKYLYIGLLGLGLTILSAKSFAQSAPPPPPTPEEALKNTGNALKKINPFKKRSGNSAAPAPPAGAPALGTPPAGGPPPPPNPLNLFKKKNSASATLPVPPKPPGRD